ncbi:hypothetical protein GGF42_009493, partial [Coemansia sp. RSA 2424]
MAQSPSSTTAANVVAAAAAAADAAASQLPHSPPDTSATPTPVGAPPPALADAERWSVDDVHQWAQAQALLAPVAGVLRQHAVDGHVLLHYVTNAILAEELGIAAFGTRVHVLEAIETLRWARRRGFAKRPSQSQSQSPASDAHSHSQRLSRSASPPRAHLASPPRLAPHSPASHSRSHSHSRSASLSHSPSPSPGHGGGGGGKRSASRVADAEKKRIKRAEMKKNPALYAEYLQKERERNARRRERLRAERGRSTSGGTSADLGY